MDSGIDRGWMIVDGHDEFVTQREHPRLALITPQIEADTLRLTTPEGQAVSGIQRNNGRYWAEAPRAVQQWRDWCEAVDQGDAAAQFFSDWLGESVRLVKMADAFKRRVDPRYAKTRRYCRPS